MRRAQSACFVGLAGLLVAAASGACGADPKGFQYDDPHPTDPASSSGSSGGTFGGDPASGVALDPKNTTVIIDMATTPATAGTAAFKVVKSGQDLTAGAAFTLADPSLGSFSGATFTSVPALPDGVLGKSTIVSAKTPQGEAVGSLTVVQLRKTGPSRDFFFIVPYGQDPTPKSDTLKFSTNIKQADVAFVMDTTASMQDAIDNLKNAIQTTLLGQLQAAIPNVGLAVVDFKDFTDGSNVVRVRQTVTTNVSLAQTAVGQMSASGGADIPEADVAAMQYTLLGQANPPLLAHSNPVPGSFGAVDFRAGSVPVIVNITDATWHDPSGNATIASLKNAFTSTNAKFVQVTVGGTSEAQPNALSDDTSSNVPPSAFGTVAGCSAGQCCTGVNGAGRTANAPGGNCRLNFLSSGGTGVSTGIVKAISAIAVGSTFDVTAKASNDPKNAGGVDATKFIQALRAMDEGNPAEACPAAPAKDSDGDGIKDTFLAVKAGTPVCFEIIAAKNMIVPAGTDPQFFNALVDVIAVQGNLHLDQRSVLFLVPPKDAAVQ